MTRSDIPSPAHAPTEDAPPLFYRLEKALVGERLVPVATESEATHASIASLHRLVAESEHARHVVQAERQRLIQRVHDLEVQLGHAQHRAEQAERLVEQQQREAVQHGIVVRKIMAKNAALIGEKRRIRDMLMAKHAPIPIHYRIDVDREDQARESIIVTLDAFPDKSHANEALAEARRTAARRGGQLKTLRLDTVAWRAVVQQVIDD
jgi:hypothetical protein